MRRRSEERDWEGRAGGGCEGGARREVVRGRALYEDIGVIWDMGRLQGEEVDEVVVGMLVWRWWSVVVVLLLRCCGCC